MTFPPLLLTLALTAAPAVSSPSLPPTSPVSLQDAADVAPERDPFQPLDVPDASPRPPGLAGMRWEALHLSGIVWTPRGSVATFEGSPQGALFGKLGDRFADGVIYAIDLRGRSVQILVSAPGAAPSRFVVLAMK